MDAATDTYIHSLSEAERNVNIDVITNAKTSQKVLQTSAGVSGVLSGVRFPGSNPPHVKAFVSTPLRNL